MKIKLKWFSNYRSRHNGSVVRWIRFGNITVIIRDDLIFAQRIGLIPYIKICKYYLSIERNDI